MKKLIVIIFTLISSIVNAQSFDGISISGDLPSKIAQYKAKGYTFSQYIKNGAILKGTVAGHRVELYLFTSPKTKIVFKATVYLAKQESWYSLKREYETFVERMEEKYGEPDNHFEFFRDPYYEGDGYELSAVGLEKAVFASFWLNRNNLTIGVSISKYKQVEINYENVKNMEIAQREFNNQHAESF